MASLIGNCLAKLVAAQKISQKAADAALALHEGIQDRLYPNMGPAAADAAAALEAARVMADSAKRRKYQAAMQAIRDNDIQQRMAAHSKGNVSGLIASMTRDIWDDASGGSKLNVESLSDATAQRLRAQAKPLVEAYHSRMFGLVRDDDAIWNVIREGFGRETGDQVAKQASQAWKKTIDTAVGEVTRAGRDLAVREDWRFMQFWESPRIRKVSEKEFLDDVMAEARGGGLRLRNKVSGKDATAIEVPGIIQNAYQDIFHGRGEGGAGGFSNKMRVFQFDDPESYIRLMQKYGSGKGGLYNAMLGHIEGMSREIALVKVFGPNYEAAFKKHLTAAKEDYSVRMMGKPMAHIGRGLIRETPVGAERIFQHLTGQLSGVESELMAGIMGALRNLATAARLGTAIISAVTGDTVTAGFAAQHLGMAPTAVLARFLKDVVGDKEYAKELAAQLGLSASTVMDAALGSKRFADEIAGSGLTGRLAETIIRAQGLQAWTEGMKRAFTMEMMGLIARQSDFAFDKLDDRFANFLRRYGFSAAEWDRLRAAPQIEAEGARFFDAQGVAHADRHLADRMLSAIVDERRFAVIEPDARVRSMASGGMKRGTLLGEAARTSFLFKSFAMSIINTHLMRMTMEIHRAEGLGKVSKASRMGAFFIASAVAGAAALQASQLVQGRDPAPMDDLAFWGAAFLRGGGLGYYGDFLYSSATRGEGGVYEAFAGPVLGVGVEMAAGIAGEIPATYNWLVKGKKFKSSISGKDLAKWVKAFTPGSTLFYTRAATDRLIFDQMQSLIDPDYRQSFAREEQRIKKEFGQGFWWRRGRLAPSRAPDMGNALGR